MPLTLTAPADVAPQFFATPNPPYLPEWPEWQGLGCVEGDIYALYTPRGFPGGESCDLLIQVNRSRAARYAGLPPWGEGLELTCEGGGQVIYSRRKAWVVITTGGTYAMTATLNGVAVWSRSFTV